MPVFGVDTSDFDWSRGPMDVTAMARDGVSFLTHKATEGTKVTHQHYADALARARAAGLPVLGAYHVVRTPGNGGHGSILAQVDFFLSYLDKQTPWWRDHDAFILQCDLEKWAYDAVAPTYGVQFCEQLRRRVPNTVVLYAPRWAYGDSLAGIHPLWASDYGPNPATHYSRAYPGDKAPGWQPYSGRTPVILQFGSRLTVGNQPGMDVNAFRGTVDDLRRLAGASGRTPSPSTSRREDDNDVHYNLKAGESCVLTPNSVLGGAGWLLLSAAFGDCDVRVARFAGGGWTDEGRQHITVPDSGGHQSIKLDGPFGDKVTVTNNGPGLLAVDTYADRPWS